MRKLSATKLVIIYLFFITFFTVFLSQFFVLRVFNTFIERKTVGVKVDEICHFYRFSKSVAV